MKQNDELNRIKEQVQDGPLGQAIGLLENYMLMHQMQGGLEKLSALKGDYQLMSDYWKQGFDDPQRSQLYQQLQKRLYALVANTAINYRLNSSPFLKNLYLHPRQALKDWSIGSIRQELESYVAEMALLQLEPEHVRQQREDELAQRHMEWMQSCFEYVTTSHLWTARQAAACEELLLSPTVDAADQQHLASAISLAVMNEFDVNKLRTLIQVYTKTADPDLRQRCLVGWVLCVHNAQTQLFSDEIETMVAEVCDDERCRNELTELQIQLFYCTDAESDTQTIRNEIMPDLMNGNHIKIGHKGIEEVDEDSLEEILHPEAAEHDMERMEQGMNRMIDMQKKGADIYFGGFSQMKRFPFFNTIANWFVPYSPQHPVVRQVMGKTKGKRFLEIITSIGAFCDSDKYSFVLAFNQVLGHLPASMLQMIEQGEASPVPLGGELAPEEMKSPAFKRRMYLQNLYRFHRLFSVRAEFFNPFEPSAFLFFSNPLFMQTRLAERWQDIVSFLLKRKNYDAAHQVLLTCQQQSDSYQYQLTLGTVLQHLHDDDALACFRKALALQPDSERALAGFARAAFRDGDYEQALLSYEKLLAVKPENRSYMLNTAVCMLNLDRHEEALKLLYKLNYLDADDAKVNRVLAWALMETGKLEQAENIYRQLHENNLLPLDDAINYGCCLWFAKKVPAAVEQFRKINENYVSVLSWEDEFFGSEYQLIASHGISDTEIWLMVDALSA